MKEVHWLNRSWIHGNVLGGKCPRGKFLDPTIKASMS